MISITKFFTFFLLFGLIAGQLSSLQCRTLLFRTLNGQCTNRFDAALGAVNRAHFSYFDVDSTEMTGFDLKSARAISNIVSNQDEEVFSARRLNDLLTYFGQFLDHNVVFTPLGDEEENIPSDSEHEINDEDSPEEEELPFRRSQRVRTGSGDAQRPINVLPSAVDLSAVYGRDGRRSEALRVPNSCELKTSDGDLLPFNTEGLPNAPSTSNEFYLAGEERASENPVLTSLHTLWLREHNYLCNVLESKIPSESAENLYQLARTINIAQFQKVVFEEFFHSITGRNLPSYRGFRSDLDPTLSSVFSTAAFRVGHTLISEVVTKIFADGQVETTPLRETFFVPDNVGLDGIDPLIRGAAQTKAQEIDVMVVDSLRNFLFENVEEEEGPDLIALNLQRSRDHNIPSFNEIRRFFGIPPARSFAEITNDRDVQEKLAKAYDSVDDVEAWIGMMAENKMPDSSMGLTMFNVWRLEFLRLREGDQFVYLQGRTYPGILRRNWPEIVNEIRDPRVRLFEDIILRNTRIAPEDLNPNDIFNAN